MTDFRISSHAEWEMARRGIPLALVAAIMEQPEQRLADESHAGRWVYQSRLRFDDEKIYLLRVVVDEGEQPLCRGRHRLPDQQGREVLERQMKVVYDPEVDVLSVLLSDAPVAESDQDKPGVILDYDASGNMVSFEILDASVRMPNPLSVEYAVMTPLKRPA